MAVIHLKDRSTNDALAFNDQRSSHASMLFVNNETAVERFSLELTVGAAWAKVFSPKQKDFIQIDAGGIRIGRHDSIVIEVAEDIQVPNNMYGILVPTGSMFLGLGILIAPAKIEPGYSGKLMLRLFNTTAEKHTLKTGQKLGSAIFFSTDTTMNHAPFMRERGASVKEIKRSARIWQWFRTNPLLWIPWLVTLIGSSTMSVLITTIILRNNPPQTSQQNQTSHQRGAAVASPPAKSASQAASITP